MTSSEKNNPSDEFIGPQKHSPAARVSGWINSPGAKFIIVGIITVLLLLPTLLVWGLVEERGSRARVVAHSISKGWGGVQTINGPYLAVPYTTQVQTGETTRTQTNFALLSAETSAMEADVAVEKRKKSIYSTQLYHSKIRLKGRFGAADMKPIIAVGGTPDLDNAFMVMGVSDNSGFRSQVSVKINEESLRTFEPGTRYIRSHGPVVSVGKNTMNAGGVHLDVSADNARNGFKFDVQMALNGSRSFHLVPSAKNSKFDVKSNWPHPGFDGRFLPESRKISDAGFSAQWTVPFLARGIDAVWLSRKLPSNGSVISINFVEPLKFYQLVSRTLKYAIAFFALIFLAAFIMEQTGKNPIHWIQYILVGLAMVIFYIMLLALAEHFGFHLAYLVSSMATTILIAWYVGESLGGRRNSWIMGGVIGLSYFIIYLVLKEQEYALLAGSLIAFAAIAVTMFATRKVDWSRSN